MSTEPEQPQPPAELPDSITFIYTRSSDFRVVHMDGVWGGATPGGEISAAIFVERQPFPESNVFTITEAGTLGEEKERKKPDGIERELQVDVRMSLTRAIAFRNWLDRHIKQLQDNEEAAVDE